MKTKVKDINLLIKDSLSDEEVEIYDNLEEQNIFQMVIGIFKGKNKWVMLLMNIMTLVFFGLFIYCVVQFFEVETTKEQLKWWFGSVVFILGVSMLKVFAWIQMDKNALLREMKRLELQIASLARKIS